MRAGVWLRPAGDRQSSGLPDVRPDDTYDALAGMSGKADFLN
jgi:hypothetical protein